MENRVADPEVCVVESGVAQCVLEKLCGKRREVFQAQWRLAEKKDCKHGRARYMPIQLMKECYSEGCVAELSGRMVFIVEPTAVEVLDRLDKLYR